MLGLFNRPPKGVMLALFEFSRRHGFGKRTPDPAEAARLAFDPDASWAAIVDAGSALLDAGRFKEADVVLENGLFAFPDDPILRVKHALSANNSGRYKIAIVRWQAALQVAPEQPICRVGAAANYRELGDIANARRWITGALQLWPRDNTVIGEAARIAETDQLFAEALPLWAKLSDAPEPHPDYLRGHAYCLIRLGRFDEAAVALKVALSLYPDDHRLLGVEAMLASAQEDWPRAMDLWSAYRRRFPDDGTGLEHYERTVQASRPASAKQERDVAVAVAIAAPARAAPREDEETKNLLLGFESIGDNCEFGLVQRHFGVEPAGLLGWGEVAIDELVAALDSGFANIGDAAHTEQTVLDSGEFVVSDKRWGIRMRTFLVQGEADPELLYREMCQRVARLRDKLLVDLAAAQKVFVFRSEGLDGAQIEMLHRAVWAYGPVRLLSVQPVDAKTGFHGEPGQVVEIDQRRFVGFLGRLGATAGDNWDIAFDDWMSICHAVAA